jgi:pimeloyl-ACP methyl ester carboxylesterase
MSTQSIYKSPAGERAVMALYDKVLADHWPKPYDALNIPTRHGAGSNSAIWAGDVAVYSQGHRVYAVDLPGEPGKSAPNRPAWDSPAYAEWLEDVFDALEIKKGTLLGVSQGGWTALKFATYQPQLVEKLVLLCPGGVVPDRTSFYIRFLPLLLLGRRGVRRANRMLFGDQPVPEEADEYLTLALTHFKPRTGVVPVFSDEALRRLSMPVLLLGGTRDAIRDTQRIAARMEKLLPQLTAIVIPGAGHVLLDTRDHILPFLAS